MLKQIIKKLILYIVNSKVKNILIFYFAQVDINSYYYITRSKYITDIRQNIHTN